MSLIQFKSPKKELEAFKQDHYSEIDRIENAKSQAIDLLDILKQEAASELALTCARDLIEILFEDKEICL